MGAFPNPLAITVPGVSLWVTFGSFTRIGVALVPVSRFSSTAAIASCNTILHPYLLSKYILGNPLIIIPGIWKVLFPLFLEPKNLRLISDSLAVHLVTRLGISCTPKLESDSSDVTSDDSTGDHEVSCQTTERFGHLYCQYNETASPYDRVPLTDKANIPITLHFSIQVLESYHLFIFVFIFIFSVEKKSTLITLIDHLCNGIFDQINELAQSYPALLKFQSVQLSPYSWMAVAWYARFLLLLLVIFDWRLRY